MLGFSGRIRAFHVDKGEPAEQLSYAHLCTRDRPLRCTPVLEIFCGMPFFCDHHKKDPRMPAIDLPGTGVGRSE